MRALGLIVGVILAVTAPSLHANAWPTPAAGKARALAPELLLTFDDGPNPATTPLVLDELKRRGLTAVFFIVGEMVDANPKGQALLRRIEAEGHVLANHTMRHKDLCRVPPEVADADIDQGLATLQAEVGMPITWFRAPYGAKCQRLEAALTQRNIQHFHWDLDPQEWKHPAPERTLAYVTHALARSTDRYVLLLHDTKQATTRALPMILDWIDAENLKREAIGRKPIRVISPSEIARERLAFDPAGLAQLPARALLSVLP